MITIEIVAANAPAERVQTLRALMAEYAALPHTVGRWPTMASDVAMLPIPFVAPLGVMLVAMSGDDVLGCGGLIALEEGVGEIKRMYVRPAARGRGIGAALLTGLLAHATEMGFARVRLDTAPELQAAQALYRSFGFSLIPSYREGLLPDALCFERSVLASDGGAANTAPLRGA